MGLFELKAANSTRMSGEHFLCWVKGSDPKQNEQIWSSWEDFGEVTAQGAAVLLWSRLLSKSMPKILSTNHSVKVVLNSEKFVETNEVKDHFIEHLVLLDEK